MRGQADRAHAAPRLPEGGRRAAQDETGRTAAVQLRDQVGTVRGLRIPPPQEVQVLPGPVGQITRHGQAPRLTLRAVHERGTDLLLSQRLHNGRLICLNTLGKRILSLAKQAPRTNGRGHGCTRRTDHGTPDQSRSGPRRRGRLRPGDRLGTRPALRRQGREPVLPREEHPRPQDQDRPPRPGGTRRPGRRRRGRTGGQGRPDRLRERLPRLRPGTPRPGRSRPDETRPRDGGGQRGRPARPDDPGDPARLRPDGARPDPRGPPPGQRLPRLRQPGTGGRLQPQRPRLTGDLDPDHGRPRRPAAQLAVPFPR